MQSLWLNSKPMKSRKLCLITEAFAGSPHFEQTWRITMITLTVMIYGNLVTMRLFGRENLRELPKSLTTESHLSLYFIGNTTATRPDPSLNHCCLGQLISVYNDVTQTQNVMLLRLTSTSISSFLHHWPGISPWIELISNKLDIIIHVIASQLPGHCDVISNRLCRISRTKTEHMRHGEDM